jgi:antirestriction protein ArdC
MLNVFSKFDVNITYKNIQTNECLSAGQYIPSKDVIILDKRVDKDFPVMRKIILLHEMFHSTLSQKRTNRLERLIKKFGEFKEDSLSFKTEECIAEICTMVASKKLGLLNQYTSIVIEDGIKDNYTQDMIIPWMEVVSALRYFCEDDIDFSKELDYVKKYLIEKYDMKIRSSYENNSVG